MSVAPVGMFCITSMICIFMMVCLPSTKWGLRGARVPMRAQASDWAPSKRRSMGAAACGQSGRGLERTID